MTELLRAIVYATSPGEVARLIEELYVLYRL